MTREKEIEETINEYFNFVDTGKGYRFPVGFMDDGHFYAYAIHESGDDDELTAAEQKKIHQEKNVFWHMRRCETFTNRELGLMAAAGISTILGARMMEDGTWDQPSGQ